MQKGFSYSIFLQILDNEGIDKFLRESRFLAFYQFKLTPGSITTNSLGEICAFFIA